MKVHQEMQKRGKKCSTCKRLKKKKCVVDHSCETYAREDEDKEEEEEEVLNSSYQSTSTIPQPFST
ncbi:hypothetical protein C1645_835305 [Glomus cerebriforme]|uniref:Uncharacterized protein n=1 Tax=Glomus cerebriforme TaxID=658196 RepID=A0A397SCB0_9GLOM|nr:hypothetical protein C1645_835305 [Glomus cerebriforme]